MLRLRQRIEADDAWVMQGAPAAFRCRVWHDLGGARSLRVTLSAPTGRDDFTARTQLAQATLLIPATQEHDAVVALTLLAGCGNGLEVEIALDCPHAASTWIGLGDLQLTRGGEPAPFAFTPIGVDAARVARQLRTLSTATGRANSGSTLQLLLSHPAMRAAPCYVATAPLRVTDAVTADWNHLARVLIAHSRIDGVLLTVTSGDWQDPNSFGDTPNANKFHDVRVYSLAAPMTGVGFHVSAGRFNNSFFDCEANLHPDGTACLRPGASCDETLIVNFYAESLGALPAIDLHAEARNSAIINLFSATGGAAIWDPGGGRHYTAINAGADVETHLRSARQPGTPPRP